ncbi:MAG: ATP-dependent protease subunit HslV [Candidatus Coatesbacteria bacterium]|nr:ATP-dependent protease subunit HslV [Candidatus Coatesbacteria bacterium]
MCGTTVIAVKRDGRIVMAGDGQVTLGETVMKHNAKKIRKLYSDKVLCGFAGSAGDSFALLARFDAKLEEFRGNLPRAAVELAKEWRTDKSLRRLEALIVAADKDNILLVSGSGDVVEPDDDVIGIGSGGPYALSAAKALMSHTNLNAREIAEASIKIAASLCIYTNENITIDEL